MTIKEMFNNDADDGEFLKAKDFNMANDDKEFYVTGEKDIKGIKFKDGAKVPKRNEDNTIVVKDGQPEYETQLQTYLIGELGGKIKLLKFLGPMRKQLVEFYCSTFKITVAQFQEDKENYKEDLFKRLFNKTKITLNKVPNENKSYFTFFNVEYADLPVIEEGSIEQIEKEEIDL